jgi:hypothetical protein
VDSKSSPVSPWLLPGFLVSSCAVVLIAALAIYVAVSNATDHGVRRTAEAGIAPSPSPPSPDAGCRPPTTGPPKPVVDLRNTRWRYSDAMAYTASAVYGPAVESDHGFRICFQHSVGGALFSAANSLAFENTSPDLARDWSEYMLADGPYRHQLLTEEYVANDPDIRLQIIGYRILSYADNEALVDIAARASTAQETMIISCVSHLVWQRGDWRFSTDLPEPVNVVRIGDVGGYTAWRAD